MTDISHDLAWWISVIELPVITGLLWLIWQTRCESVQRTDQLSSLIDMRSEQWREALGAFKLEVAKGYASQKALRDLESRLVQHLLRIESKLDKTALKAEALKAKSE
jgi:hypothetical protein